MAMTWTSLVAPKGTAGSLANWVGYAKLDTETIVDEAQSLLFQMLRVREMRTEWMFGMAVGHSNRSLPARFLDPVGRIFDITNNTTYGQGIESEINGARVYAPLSGTLALDPFTFTAGSSLVNVELTAHGINQDSALTIAAAVSTANLDLNDTFPVVGVVDANNFTIDAGTEANASEGGGGANATYSASNLVAGLPSRWAVWDEQLKFDVAFDTSATLKMLYYRAPALLSSTNASNWLTVRYPMLMRKACQAAAADFMKDDVEYKKGVEALVALIQSTAAENDLAYRGAEFGTDTP
jgi:hypothetical protein